MYTLDELRDDIRAVVDYNIRSEERDFEVQEEAGNQEACEAHVLHPLRRLDAFANGEAS